MKTNTQLELSPPNYGGIPKVQAIDAPKMELPPGTIIKESAPGKSEVMSPVAAIAAPAAPAAGPTSAPTKIGNLLGEVDADGHYKAATGPFQGGGVYAKVGEVSGFSRVRVIPPLPWKFDFEKAPVGVPPLTWLRRREVRRARDG